MHNVMLHLHRVRARPEDVRPRTFTMCLHGQSSICAWCCVIFAATSRTADVPLRNYSLIQLN